MENIAGKQISYIILIMLCIYPLLFYITSRDMQKKKNIKPENLFLVVALIFCILLTIAMPMSQGHDETIHGLRIYEYAEGKIISNGEKAYLEQGVINALQDKTFYREIFNQDKTYSTKTNEIAWGYRIASYSPINYLPQVIGVVIGRIFTTNSMVHLYMARLFNILSCITIMYFAIKVIPYGKNLLFLLSCIPITIEGVSTLSADGLLVATSFFFISYILYLCNLKDRKIGKKEISILLISAITISLSKTIYIVLLLLLIMIPKEKWKSNKQRIISIFTIFMIAAILDIGWYFIGIQSENPSSGGNNALGIMLAHPFMYMQKIVYTLVHLSGKYIDEIFGGKLEWGEQITIYLLPYILLVASILVSAKGKEKPELKIWQKIIAILTILGCIFLAFTSMFLAWSRTNIQIIEGVQGRYFMPIIPLVFLVAGKKFADDEKTTNIVSILVTIVQIFVIMELVIFHI